MSTADTQTNQNPNSEVVVEMVREGYKKANAVEFDMSEFGYSNTSDEEIDARRNEFENAKIQFLGIIRDIAINSGINL